MGSLWQQSGGRASRAWDGTMEATEVGGPNPSDPQGHLLLSSQQLGGGLRGSQGPRTNSGYFSQGLSLSTEPITDGTCGPASQAHPAEPIHHLLWGPAEVSSQWDYEPAAQGALRLSTSPFSSPITGTQTHLTESRTLAPPVCMHSDSTSDTAQHGPFQLQTPVVGGGKAPAKVLIGWGKGYCSPSQTAPSGNRKSQRLPCLLSRVEAAVVQPGPGQALTSSSGCNPKAGST